MKNQDSKTIEKMVNSSNWNPIEVGVELTTAHRFLQQEFFCMMLHFIRQTSINFDKGWYDERNEFAAKCCKVMQQALDEADLTYFSKWQQEEYEEILKQS